MPSKRPLLVFLNEVAGGRKLLQAVRERQDRVSRGDRRRAAEPAHAGAACSTDEELYDSARARVEVTMSVLRPVRDRLGRRGARPLLAAGARRRAPRPRARRGPLLGPLRHPLRDRPQRPGRVVAPSWPRPAGATFTHIPVRLGDDSIRLDLTHVLVVATQTVAAPDLIARLKERAAVRPHRYTIVSPRTESVAEEQVVRDLATTLAELYRAEVDATGQLASPDPLRGGPQRDRALQDRRDPDLHLRRRAVALARGRSGRPRPRDHRQACHPCRGRPHRCGRRRDRRRGE